MRLLSSVMWMLAVSPMVLGTSVASGQATSTGSGQEYPNKPIRIVTAAAGGGTDFQARLLAQGISGPLGQQVIVDNRSAVFYSNFLPKAPPDGYSLLVGGEGLWIVPLLQKVDYDPVRDFAPVSLIASTSNILVVHPSVPVKSVKDLVELAKAKPGVLNYGSTVPGGSTQLAAKLFMSLTGINMQEIPHNGAGPLVISLLSGQVQVSFVSVNAIAPHVKSGKLTAVAITSLKPSALFPELPTVAATVPGYHTGGESALFAPLGTPAAIIRRLNQETVRFLHTAEAKEWFLNTGLEVVGSSPEELTAWIKSEMARWGKVIKEAGIKLD